MLQAVRTSLVAFTAYPDLNPIYGTDELAKGKLSRNVCVALRCVALSSKSVGAARLGKRKADGVIEYFGFFAHKQ